VQGDCKGGECLVLGDSIIRNVGSECSDMKLDDWNFERDVFHINRRGARRLGQLYSRV